MGSWGVPCVVMTRPAALLLTAVLVVASVSALPVAASGPTASPSVSSAALQADGNATNVTAGQRLAGVIGAGQAEFDGAVALRAYGIEYAAADSNASKAGVIEERLAGVRERLQELEERREALLEARRNGSISEGEYRARVTALAARGQQLEQLVNASEVRARGLPADVLAERGINVTAIRTLQAQAANLTGQEVAEIARGIAGPEVGRSIDRGPPSDVGGPPDDVPGAGAGNETEDEGSPPALSEPQSP